MRRATRLGLSGLRRADSARPQDDSDVCLAFAAAIVRAERGPVSVEGWDVWRNAHASTWATRLFTAALTAIRAGRDHTAILLLEGALEAGTIEPVLSAQALYHLGSALKRRARNEDARACFARLGAGDLSTLLPPPVQAALHFHLGELDLQDDRPASSIEHFEACLEINAAHARARALLAEAVTAAAAAA